MDANPTASDLHAVPDDEQESTDRRWWSNKPQQAYLLSQLPHYLLSKAVTGGATLFFRKIDTEFMTRWSPASLVVQFNLCPRGPIWKGDCPSLSQDLATATRNEVPDRDTEYRPEDSTITRIRKVHSFPCSPS